MWQQGKATPMASVIPTGVSNDFSINEHVVAHAGTHRVIHLELVSVIVVKIKVSRGARNIAAPLKGFLFA